MGDVKTKKNFMKASIISELSTIRLGQTEQPRRKRTGAGRSGGGEGGGKENGSDRRSSGEARATTGFAVRTMARLKRTHRKPREKIE